MKQRLAAKQQRLQQRLAKKRGKLDAARKDRGRGPRIVIALLMAAIVLLFLLLCQCGEGSPEPEPEPQPGPPVELEPEPVEEPPPVPTPKKKHAGTIDRKDRPEFAGRASDRLPWLSAFRMQVSARSPRLATCFIGADAPGALKWTTSVDPREGTVAQHSLESVLLTRDLTRAENECVLAVLQSPLYKLPAEGDAVTPTRVSLVIEF